MTWPIISLLASLGGLLRYVEGASETELPFKAKIPSATWRVAFMLTAATVAYIASSMIVASVLIGLLSTIVISAGYTEWQSLSHQLVRGAAPAAAIAAVLSIGGFQGWWDIPSVLGSILFILCYTAAYVIYYWTENGNGKTITPPFGHWEQWCRVIQGAAICLAPVLV